MDNSKDYYSILGVPRSASQDDIKHAFRKLSMENHPDRQAGKPEAEQKAAEARFKDIAEAYSILGNPEKRSEYDAYGKVGNQGANFGQDGFFRGFGGFDFNFGNTGGGSPFGFGPGGFGFGESAFRPSSSRPREQGPEDGKDIQIQIGISVVEQIHGTTKGFRVNVPKTCPECSGFGGIGRKECDVCKGSGRVVLMSNQITTVMGMCHACDGTGTRFEHLCTSCKGEGRIVEAVDLTTKIPAGTVSGDTVETFDGLGQGGLRGGSNGNLLVKVSVDASTLFNPHARFDLETVAFVNPIVSIVGGTVKVPSPDGFLDLDIKPGTQEGWLIVVPEHGLMRQDGKRGRLLVKVRYVSSDISILTPEQMESLKAISTAMGQSGPEFRHQELRLKELLKQ